MSRNDAYERYEHVHRRWAGVRAAYMSSYTDPAVRRQAEDGSLPARLSPSETLLIRVRRVLDREPQTLMDR